jgi:hypothetical protein
MKKHKQLLIFTRNELNLVWESKSEPHTCQTSAMPLSYITFLGPNKTISKIRVYVQNIYRTPTTQQPTKPQII